jgi:hypothetical protein
VFNPPAIELDDPPLVVMPPLPSSGELGLEHATTSASALQVSER